MIDHEALDGDIALACVDGRSAESVVASPGGSMGEFLVALCALEAKRGRALTSGEVAEALRAVVDQLGRFYHHTDRASVERLRPGLTEAWLADPPAEEREALLEALVQAEHTGCGHLAGMLRRAEEYGVRAELVREAVAAFHRQRWAGEGDLIYEVLEGEHAERKVRILKSAGDGPGAKVRPTAPAGEAFVFHPDAARWVRRRMLEVLAGGEAEGLFESAEAIAAQQHGETFERLAGGLERIEEI